MSLFLENIGKRVELMKDIEIRTAIKLTLDAELESQLASEIKELASHRKLGGYLTKLLRFVNDHKEEMASIGFESYDKNLTAMRKQHTGTLMEKVNNACARVELYGSALMAMETFLVASRQLGLPVNGKWNDKTENKMKELLAAQIELQKKLNELRGECIGMIPVDGSGFEVSTEQVANKAFDLLIQRYENELSAYSARCDEAEGKLRDIAGLVGMQRAMLSGGVPVNVSYTPVQTEQAVEKPVVQGEETVKKVVEPEVKTEKKVVETEVKTKKGSEKVNFSEEDMRALDDMFG